ncbi:MULTISPECIES: carbohydrate ABC transporter permease [unclassified Streptomyces]|uniref:carbohydrate ABC transporter permease n=1 Tax=unclassified Streptomyces TaxID=2593676 RepID=UPI0022B72166|nr:MULTISPECIES: carbohydrate ABC transporter permease [unclassified Streptomyces]MCZ7415980.1 carbohydrate ABC transporter permease [Streptomyces sp. WMMC897]MCZ7434213.1 carbohydrate ABC transporter permease [Streptomyces sp. WMMC1477]
MSAIRTDRPAGDDAPADTPPASGGPAPGADRKARDGATLNVFSGAFLVLWAVMAAGPLLWVMVNSLRDSAKIQGQPFGWPTDLSFENFANAWSDANIGQFTLNSVIVLAGSLPGTMLLGSMAAYVIARFGFFGNRAVYLLFAGGMMFPIILAVVPLFFVMDTMGLLDTRAGLILVYIAYSLPFTTFFMTAFFRTLPGSVAEAAMIDGASHSRTFFQIMLPMAKPGLISIGIFNFLGQWNQFFLPLALNSESRDEALLTQGLAELSVSQGYEGDWGALFAGLTIAMLPILVVYMVFQRQVQEGLTAGAVK